MITTALSLALLPALVMAGPNPQYGYSPPSPSSSSDSAPAAAPSAPANTANQMNINVAADGNFVFSPTNVTAANGTLITFFFPGGDIPHSVTQGDFSNPCQPLAASNGNGPGFDSGLQTNVQWTLNVTNDQIPIYFFCKQITHCGLGMVGSINAPATGNTFDAWQAAAVKVGASEQALTDNGPVTGGVGAIATAPPAAATSSSGSTGTNGVMRMTASGLAAAMLGLSVAMFLA